MTKVEIKAHDEVAVDDVATPAIMKIDNAPLGEPDLLPTETHCIEFDVVELNGKKYVNTGSIKVWINDVRMNCAGQHLRFEAVVPADADPEGAPCGMSEIFPGPSMHEVLKFLKQQKAAEGASP